MAGLVNIDVGGFFKGIFGIVDQLVVDKDKAAELKFYIRELQHKLDVAIITMKTVPWVDATVKLLYAFQPFFRPIGSFAMAIFAAYCDLHNIELGKEVKVMLYGSPIAWGLSRHINKMKGAK